MRTLVFTDEDYDRLVAAAEAEGITPEQWLHNLAMKHPLPAESSPGPKAATPPPHED